MPPAGRAASDVRGQWEEENTNASQPTALPRTLWVNYCALNVGFKVHERLIQDTRGLA